VVDPSPSSCVVDADDVARSWLIGVPSSTITVVVEMSSELVVSSLVEVVMVEPIKLPSASIDIVEEASLGVVVVSTVDVEFNASANDGVVLAVSTVELATIVEVLIASLSTI